MVDSNVCCRQACIKGTRVIVYVILDNSAANTSQDEVLHSYPSLDQESVQIAVAYAAEAANSSSISS